MLSENMKAKLFKFVPKSLLLKVLSARSIARGDNPELKVLSRFNRGGAFVDVGANIGDYARVGCTIFGRVIAFEPIPRLAEKLKRELGHKAQVENVALSDSSGTATLRLPRSEGQEVTGLATIEVGANHSTEYTSINVELRRLDDYRLQKVDLIKIDVEGHEASMIAGGLDTIQRCKPAMIVEIEDRHHPGRTKEIFDKLEEIGMTAFYFNKGMLHAVDNARSDAEINTLHDGSYGCNFIFVWDDQIESLRDLIVQ